MIGFIYIMSNPLHPEDVKIGQSSKDPNERRKELASTGVLEEFVLEYRVLTEDYASLEKEIHRNLAEVRVRADREFFKISVPEAIEKIREIAGTRIESEKVYYVSPEELQRVKDEKQRVEDENQKKILEEAEAKAQILKEEQRIKFLNFENRAKELAEESTRRKEKEESEKELKIAKDIRVAENMARIKEHNKPLNKFKRNAVEGTINQTKSFIQILGICAAIFIIGNIVIFIFSLI